MFSSMYTSCLFVEDNSSDTIQQNQNTVWLCVFSIFLCVQNKHFYLLLLRRSTCTTIRRIIPTHMLVQIIVIIARQLQPSSILSPFTTQSMSEKKRIGRCLFLPTQLLAEYTFVTLLTRGDLTTRLDLPFFRFF